MSEVKLTASVRTTFGKGAARQLRRAAQVPAVLYGHGSDPIHLALPTHETGMALRTPNVLLSLDIEGKGSELAIPKAVQRDPLKGFLEHVDLLLVKRGEKVTVEVPVVAEGELAAGGNLLEHVLNTLSVEAEATHLPVSFTVSVEGLEAGASVLAQDVVLPSGVTLVTEGDAVVLQVLAAQAEEPAAEGAEGEAAEGAEA
ncbi:50S ribosomal protein L25/general stress protein Ctc [Streptomyces sp. SKN60]|uniref:50S ribosomal protein L25/general stress protein Ctc n=1 Tax=Streptomyces sp. SKN60 TaxID=2855506 RepID=UPI002245FB5C|nr:50S ribosomal protein L25/general stress protein Ctc [Streptomyces sp. SKN60]MCX2183171.1 50S ribosomal protein L25/general stress protein Ctc [Streptomyces sp. SKN60]